MNTKKTRRSLLWGVLLCGVAGTLIGSTREVRAETVVSSAALAVDGPTAKPYFWVELAQQLSQQQLISDDFPTHHNYYVNICGVSVAQATYRALSSQALD